ncbi:MAG: cytochrome c oxidase subunit 3 [Alphaproteobacteria bacterium]|nr:cytochrome c oxidase subunit 3 [Alphaproteobacteria bacterium]
MSTHEQKHPYHLVDPSPWPAVGALSAFTMAVGLLMWMHDKGILVLLLGTAAVLGTMFFWFRDVVRESESGLYHTPVVNLGIRYGMVLFIASEVMFFVAFFWAYFNAALFPTEAIGGVWPPEDILTFAAFDLPFVNTLILLLSGCTVTWAHHALRVGNRRDLIRGLALTVALGLLFTSIQAYEYSIAAFSFDQNVYTSTFYMATGFHGFHVIVGTIMLIICLIRAMKGHFTNEEHFGFEATAWYWHFVDVVWLFLFVCVYWWGEGNVAPH